MDTEKKSFYEVPPGQHPVEPHHPTFTLGELFPIRGAFWKLVHCSGNKIILEYSHPTSATAKKMKDAKKTKKR